MSGEKNKERTDRTAGEVKTAERSSLLKRVDGWLAWAENGLNYGGMVVIIALMTMVVIQVTGRYIFNRPIQGYIDYMEMMMAVLVFLTLALCQREGGHIRMDMFMERVLKGGLPYKIDEFVQLLFSFIGFAIIAVFSMIWAINAYKIGDGTVTVMFPTWPAKSLVAIGSIFLSFRFVIQMVQSVAGMLVKEGGS
jgi:C4-dicarboxylate transporter DctQ subunit